MHLHLLVLRGTRQWWHSAGSLLEMKELCGARSRLMIDSHLPVLGRVSSQGIWH